MYTRQTIINQLTYDPNAGFTGQLPADGPVILGWAERSLLPIDVEGHEARRTANILWFIPTELRASGGSRFGMDLMRSSVVRSDAGIFSKEPNNYSFAEGEVEVSYRPVAFGGSIDATELVVGMQTFSDGNLGKPEVIEPLPAIPPPCDNAEDRPAASPFDSIPEVELYDLDAEAWVRLPHFVGGTRYAIDEPAGSWTRRPGRSWSSSSMSTGSGLLQLRTRIGGDHRMTPIVRTEGLVKRYDGTVAVAGVDLSVDRG